ncbi:TetR/AcrR family transcriptional regulator [Lujinxingia vulgaris]|uniref:TetR/AcrR family transcriptional regulator n=1 Tax=Lujinxingia vulgaris TaxID=2600176 RepID=UPI0024BF9CFD|nr:TetR/AcrR family transcriptional regulator [Lujinxingia vulgaris]
MVEHDETQPRKEPVQERSRALVEALIEATARILQEDGIEALTTNRVAEVAGTSIGSLYQYFPNKEALLAALVERELARDMELVRAVVAGGRGMTLREVMAQVCERLVAQNRRRGELHRVILPRIDEVHRGELVQREREGLGAYFRALVEAHRDELPARLREGEGAARRRECAMFVAMSAMEQALNAIKVDAPQMLEQPELGELLLRIFEAVMLQE